MRNRLFCQICSTAAKYLTVVSEEGKLSEASLCATHFRQVEVQQRLKRLRDQRNRR